MRRKFPTSDDSMLHGYYDELTQIDVSLMGSRHECGHALYDLAYPDKDARSPPGHGASLGIHESQSRLWGYFVGRSHSSWENFYPQIRKKYGELYER